jgi:glutathione peroxidase
MPGLHTFNLRFGFHQRNWLRGMVCALMIFQGTASWSTENPTDLQKASVLSPSKDSPCPAALNFVVDRLQDEKPQNLCQYAGKVVLVVNTASYCGFTPQYKDLEALYGQYKERGLVVLGFPSNDFSQEPDGNQQIADFCENTYGVKFPMFTKTTVKGAQATPLFKWLIKRTNTAPKWNFYKYLISRDGQTVESFGSLTGPLDKTFLAHVQEALNTKVH